ncbi:hypothetical protein [Nostoc sp.]
MEDNKSNELTEILAIMAKGCPHCHSPEIEYDCQANKFECFDCGFCWNPH